MAKTKMRKYEKRDYMTGKWERGYTLMALARVAESYGWTSKEFDDAANMVVGEEMNRAELVIRRYN